MIRCASVSSYMGPYISNYILSEVALERKFKEQGDYLVHIFPKDVENKEWVRLFREIDAKVYFIEYAPSTLRSIKTLRQIFKEENINIIHCHFGGWDLDAKFAAPFIPMIWHQRMYVNLNTMIRKIKYWVKYNIIGMFNTVNIAISDAVYDAIASITKKKTYCIPNCIEFERVKIDLPLRLQKSKIKEKCKVLLFGYSPYVKGLDIACKACDILDKKGFKIELGVVSQPVSDEYIAENFQPRPLWLNVLKPSNNVSEYYNEADIFLSASRSEGFSNSLLEAIYCGCPAVYSDIPGTKWASTFAHTFEYEVESPESLARTIEMCYNTPITEKIIEDNRKKAVKIYSIDSWVEKVYKVLKEHHQHK